MLKFKEKSCHSLAWFGFYILTPVVFIATVTVLYLSDNIMALAESIFFD